MRKTQHPCYEEDYIDLTAMDYERWVEWLFTTNHNEWSDFCITDPERIVEYATRLFTEFAKAARPYTHGQVDGALWFLLGAQMELGEYLMDKHIPLAKRLDCIRAMYHPFADYLAPLQGDYEGSGFFMWWDLIVDNYFWGPEFVRLADIERMLGASWHEVVKASKRSRRVLQKPLQVWEQLYRQVDADHRALLDETLQVLKRILQLDDICCQGAALHGLGHLHHPEGWQLVQEYIQRHRSTLTEDAIAWMRTCRDGVVM